MTDKRHLDKILNTYVASDLVGEFHDASMCTFDGSECYVASICWSKKREGRNTIIDVMETSSPDEAREWVKSELRKRTGIEPELLYKSQVPTKG